MSDTSQYYNIPGTDVTIPVMTLGEDLMNLSISGCKHADPVANATKKGKVPTLGEVKRSLKVCNSLTKSFTVLMLLTSVGPDQEFNPSHDADGYVTESVDLLIYRSIYCTDCFQRGDLPLSSCSITTILLMITNRLISALEMRAKTNGFLLRMIARRYPRSAV